MNTKAIESFEKIDPERITGDLIENFSPNIDWEQEIFEVDGKKFGIFFIREAKTKPVIAQKDAGKDQLIKSGDIFFRYSGRTQKIRYSELENLIQKRIEIQNREWLNLISKISKIGPSNVAILDTEQGVIEKADNQVLMIDEKLMDSINFIPEFNSGKKERALGLKIVGSLQPIKTVEVKKTVNMNPLEIYPLSFTELVHEIRKNNPDIGKNGVIDAIKVYKIKEDPRYSYLNFRSKTHEEKYKKSAINRGIPSIYNQHAVDFLLTILSAK